MTHLSTDFDCCGEERKPVDNEWDIANGKRRYNSAWARQEGLREEKLVRTLATVFSSSAETDAED